MTGCFFVFFFFSKARYMNGGRFRNTDLNTSVPFLIVSAPHPQPPTHVPRGVFPVTSLCSKKMLEYPTVGCVWEPSKNVGKYKRNVTFFWLKCFIPGYGMMKCWGFLFLFGSITRHVGSFIAFGYLSCFPPFRLDFRGLRQITNGVGKFTE